MESSRHSVLNQLFNNWSGGNDNEDRYSNSNPPSTNTDISTENLILVPPTPTQEPHHQPPVLANQNISNSNPGNESITTNVVPEIDTEVEIDQNSDLSNNTINNNEDMKASSIAQALLPLLSDLCQLTKKVGRFGLKLMSMNVIDKKTFDEILEERDGHMRLYQLYNEALNSNANNNGGPGQMLEALLTSGNENVFEFLKASVLDPTVLTELRRIERKLAAEDETMAAQRTNQSSALGVVSDDPDSDSDVRLGVDAPVTKAHRKRRVEFDEPVASFPNKKVHREGEEGRGHGCQAEEETKLMEGAGHPVRGQIQFQRRLGPPCSSHKGPTFTACREFNEESRQRIFDVFWTVMNEEERREYVTSLIRLVPSCKSRNISADGAQGSSRGIAHWLYALELNGQKRRVCLRMFASTLAMKGSTIRRWFRQQSSPMLASTWSSLLNYQVQLLSLEGNKEPQSQADNMSEVDDQCANNEEAMPDPSDVAKTSASFTSRATSVGSTEGHRHDSSDALSVDPASYSWCIPHGF